jgi:hypothetical protein
MQGSSPLCKAQRAATAVSLALMTRVLSEASVGARAHAGRAFQCAAPVTVTPLEANSALSGGGALTAATGGVL